VNDQAVLAAGRPIELSIDGNDLTDQLNGRIDKALARMLDHPSTPRPPAIAHSSAAAVNTSVVVRRQSVIRCGLIFGKCRERGLGGLEEPPPGAMTRPDVVEELANQTVAKSLHYFRENVLMRGQWNPNRGASIKSYFIGQCLIRFPNIYRAWLRTEASTNVMLVDELAILDRPGRRGSCHRSHRPGRDPPGDRHPPGQVARADPHHHGADGRRLGPAGNRRPARHHGQGCRADPELLPPRCHAQEGNRMTTPLPKPNIQTRIERSSLGTADARKMRARTPDAIARAIVSRAAAYPARRTSTKRFLGSWGITGPSILMPIASAVQLGPHPRRV
jgi:hypothetical protein